MIGIYCITNIVNSKKYVGQSINVDKRVNEHFWKARIENDRSYNTAIHQAIRKYGKDNFKVEILEECSYEELDLKEQYYISKMNTISPNGYNILAGGQAKRAIPIFCSKCNKQITRDAKTGMCYECYIKTTRVVERPTKEELESLLRETNFSSVGRKFGVSDNSIRKWCRLYGMSTKAKNYK